MEIEKIKEIPIVRYLEKKGYTPNKIKGDVCYYSAFWRGGDNPTNVRVDTSKNLWYDYAGGLGGSIIELTMLVERCDKATALKLLTENANIIHAITPTFKAPGISESEAMGIHITKVQDLFFFPLKHYLAERGISERVARKYCKEVHYTFGDNKKVAYGIGFPTRAGSWIIRNKGFKGCSGQDISVISTPGSSALMVFEGFMDFLSYVEMYGAPKVSAVVLNSVANIKRAYPLFEDAERIYLLLDNDAKGKEIKFTVFYGKFTKIGHNDLTYHGKTLYNIQNAKR